MYEFSSDWFSWNVETWKSILAQVELAPAKVLEIGCFEGRSTVWMIENLFRPRGGTIFCVDAWETTPEAEIFFNRNTTIALSNRPDVRLSKLKGKSTLVLSELVNSHYGNFDLVYIDGSHDAPDVLCDLTLAFHLCRSGGLMICDDYLWNFGENPCSTPKLAIDSFVNCFFKRVKLLHAPLYQIFLLKL
jgi:predicted O-methyltransferase YrrM